MNASARSFLWAAGLFLFLAAGVAFFFLPARLTSGGDAVRFDVQPGMSAARIGRRLEALGLIRAHWAFQTVALAGGKSGRLKAGPYSARPSESLWGIVDRLARGDMLDTLITIPEGMNAREIAERLSPVLYCTPGDFLAAVEDTALTRSLGVDGPGLEGYLYPDSYRIVPGTPPRKVVERLVHKMIATFDEHFSERADSLGMSRHRVLTLASLIEAEAHVDEERPRIAAVFENRLAAGMKLQSDPTVAYGLGRRPERILLRDLAVPSPYNTYLVDGLPPGPICSPGAASIYATLYPLPNCRDLYFVATGDGRHLFSETNAEHNRARQRVASGRPAPTGE